MSDIAYLEARISRLDMEIERCEDEDRWVDLCQERADLEEELRFTWAELEREEEERCISEAS